jgi:integrase
MTSVSLMFDKPSRTWFARWRVIKPDGTVKFASARLMKRGDKYRSANDVKKSSEYQAIVQQVNTGDTDSTHAKLLLVVAEARGKNKPDATDAAVVERVTADDKSEAMMLTTFVDTVYFPHAEANLRGKTFREYKSIWRRYSIAEKVAGLRVKDFRVKHGAEILESITAKHDVCTSTLQHVKFMLSAVFVLAMNKGLCDSNPMTGVMLPKVRGSRETYAYNLTEILAMLRLPFDAMTKAAIGVAAFAALRESEIAGLRWADYTGDEIRVSRSIDRVKGVVNPTKTLRSAAPVPVIGTLRKLLDAYKATVALGPDGQPMPDAPIFPGTRRETCDLDKLALLVIRPAFDAAGIKWAGWHAFRRGIASNLFQLGCDELTVQRILRHSKVQVTRERYIKVRDEKIETAMTQLKQAIEDASKNAHFVQ